ncbi:hypothetical protein [Arthrobacter sp. YN]|uniref:hypothetical protein n=1 Tax=Arthrobacter sp. YN TaxID=2020486 RepID=UPI000B5FE7F9|nr:hypothetical protein [Arthrobacter sp. YN]ASN20660.1 hypothetical protein CGK93_13970 [Arthrobacter sp. YN]
MTQAMVLEDRTWTDDAMDVLAQVAKRGEPFTAYALTQAGLRNPPHPSMWGTLFRHAAERGAIRPAKVPFVRSPRPGRNGGVCAQWRAAR